MVSTSSLWWGFETERCRSSKVWRRHRHQWLTTTWRKRSTKAKIKTPEICSRHKSSNIWTSHPHIMIGFFVLSQKLLSFGALCYRVLVFFALSFHENVQMTRLIWIVRLEYLQLDGGLSRKLKPLRIGRLEGELVHWIAGRTDTRILRKYSSITKALLMRQCWLRDRRFLFLELVLDSSSGFFLTSAAQKN